MLGAPYRRYPPDLGFARQTLIKRTYGVIPKSLPSDLIRGWAPVFGKDHVQIKYRSLV
jgi:hypothetical protein